MDRSREKSLFLYRERGVWDCLTEERQSREQLTEKFTSVNQELADLTRQAEGKLKALVEKA